MICRSDLTEYYQTHGLDTVKKYECSVNIAKQVTWPKPKSTINLHRWILLLKNLEEEGYKMLHEFPGIHNGGIIQPMQSYKLLGTPLLSYTHNAFWADMELLAYKIYLQLTQCRLLGPFPKKCTHFIATKQASVNSSGKGYEIWKSPLFVVRKTDIGKWREVQDYSAASLGKSLNDIGYHELKHIKYSTVVDRCVTYWGCKFGSVLD